MMGKILTPSQQRSFARQASHSTDGEKIDGLILVKYWEFGEQLINLTDLWTVFNRVQENHFRGWNNHFHY